MKYKATIITILLTAVMPACMQAGEVSEFPDTVALDDVTVTAIKQGTFLGDHPVAFTQIGPGEIKRLNIVTMKNVSELAPNFYIPSYGSRMTSSIYVRGIGARIDQPVVGLSVDNVSFLNKDNYDFDLSDIERIEVLRGPQSTLYGRNTMGGQINIYTLSPFHYQGGRVLAEVGRGPQTRFSISYYHKFSERLAMSWSGMMNYVSGFHTNSYDGYKVGRERNFSFRWKTQARLSEYFSLDNVAALQISRQNGYPYAYEPTQEINYNDTCYYRRNSFNDGLTMKWQKGNVSVSSITSFQYIDDNMTLDQDFLPLDYFTLTQDRKEYAVTQDFVARGSAGSYSWLGGLFGFARHTNMDAPVTFRQYGIEHLIVNHRNEGNPDYPIMWDFDEFLLGSRFSYLSSGVAAYHQSTFKAGDFTFSASLRLDWERARMRFRSSCNSSYTTFHILPDGEREFFNQTPVVVDDRGVLSHNFLEFLPKLSVMWKLPRMSRSNLYVSVAKGYKAGGFNTQMFSDVLQQRVMGMMGLDASYDIDEIVSYKPEKSWNYEIGAHSECGDGKVTTDLALFYIDCRDQQLTVFPDGNTTGRVTTNAGKTRSLGGEISIKYNPAFQWLFNLSYGFTDARFVKFNNGKNDYKGKVVPYAPRNTLFAGITYRKLFSSWIDRLEANLNLRGVGEVYWDEENRFRQPFYVLPGASVTAAHRQISLTLWGENLANTRYTVFSFESMSNRFMQLGNPITFGATLRVNFETGVAF